MELINKHKCYLIDMNGVLTDITKPVDYAIEFVNYLIENQIDFYILTNNSMKTGEDFVLELEELGIYNIKPENFITSSMVSCEYILQNHKDENIYFIGENGLKHHLTQANLNLTTNVDDAHLVLMGLDSTIDYRKLSDACIVAQKTNKFIVTNSDYKFPRDGYHVPGNGTFRLAIESVTGVKATNLGKPKRVFFETAINLILKEKNYEISDFAMIGDNLQTDIEGANNFNIDSIHVLTGVHSQQDYKQHEIYPKYTIENLSYLIKE